MASDLERTEEQFRKALLARDATAAGELVKAYSQVWRRLDGQLTALTNRIADARAAGEAISPAWLQRQERYKALIAQTQREIGKFTDFTEGVITDAQRAAIHAGASNALALMQASMGPSPRPRIAPTFDRLPAKALEDLVGTLQDGSPLSDLLDQLGTEASLNVRQALVTGLAAGEGMDVLARRVRKASDLSAVRALTITRTEVLRSYRTSSIRTYQANSDMVDGWIWSATLGTGTCPMCWSMHGSFHELSELFDTHPRCRCAALPHTKSWADLGFRDIPDSRPSIEAGADVFDRLSAAQQRQILGPGKYEAFRRGDISLADLVEQTHSPQWGGGRQERSLAAALQAAES